MIRLIEKIVRGEYIDDKPIETKDLILHAARMRREFVWAQHGYVINDTIPHTLKDNLSRAEDYLKELKSFPDSLIVDMYKQKIEAAIKYRRDKVDSSRHIYDTLKQRLTDVENWTPPPGLDEVKEHALEELKRYISDNCNIPPLEKAILDLEGDIEKIDPEAVRHLWVTEAETKVESFKQSIKERAELMEETHDWEDKIVRSLDEQK